MLLGLIAFLLATAGCTSGSGSSELLYTDTTPTPCSDTTGCKGGSCGFRDCEAPVSCRGGRCMFINCHSPTCDGGGCKFVDSHSPHCRGGGCDFVQTQTILLDNFCPGGGCTMEGFPVSKKLTGGSSY